MARQLQGLNIGIQQIFSWTEACYEKTEEERIDVATAAHHIVQDLRYYRQIGTLQKHVQEAQQLLNNKQKQLSVLDIIIDRNQEAITTLTNLKSAGFSQKDINELTGLVNMWQSDIGGQGGNGSSDGSKLDDRLIGN